MISNATHQDALPAMPIDMFHSLPHHPLRSRPVLLTYLCCLLLMCSPLHASNRTTPERPLLLWQGILPYGAEEPQDQERRAFFEVGSYLQALDAWRTRVYTDLEQKPNWKHLRERMQDQDLNEFLTQQNPLLMSQHNAAGPILQLDFQGRWLETDDPAAGFNFALSDQHPPAPILPPTEPLGSVAGQARFQSGTTDADNVLTQLDLTINFGPLLFTEMLNSIEQVNRTFDLDSLTRLPIDTRIDLSRHDPEKRLNPGDQRLLHLFIQSLPNVMSVLGDITKYEQIARTDTSPDGHLVTRIATHQKVNLTRLKQRYPDTYSDFKHLLTSSSLHMRMQIDDEHSLWQIDYDAETTLFKINLALADGGYVLLRNDGSLSNRRIFPSQLKTLDYQLRTDLHLRLFGLKVDIDDLTIAAAYNAGTGSPRDNREASLQMRMRQIPQIQVSGALLYILPKWLIDLLIPGTIETMIAESFEDLVTGNHGQGMVLDFRFIEDRQQSQVQMHLIAEMPYKTLQTMLHPKDAKESNRKPRLYQDIRMQLRRDYARMAEPIRDERLATYVQKHLASARKPAPDTRESAH